MSNSYDIEKDDSRNILDLSGEILNRINDSSYSPNIKPKSKTNKKNESEVECNFCSRSFSTTHGRNIHMSRMHKTEGVYLF
jgi:hypothetical protein